MTDLELLDLQIEALFIHDARGRITRINEPEGDRAPRFFLGRTAGGNRWRVRDDVRDEIARELDRLAASEPAGGDLRAEPKHLVAYLDALGIERKSAMITSGPAFRIPEIEPMSGLEATIVRITPENFHLVQSFGWSVEDSISFGRREPFVAVIEDGIAVSVCFCSRLTSRAAEAGLETLEGFQRRRFGSAAVVAWAAAVHASGRVRLYSTDWRNEASLGVARRLGLAMYGSDLSIS